MFSDSAIDITNKYFSSRLQRYELVRIKQNKTCFNFDFVDSIFERELVRKKQAGTVG